MPFLTQMKCVSLSSDEMNCTAMLFDFILFDEANSGCIKKKVSGISNHLLEYMLPKGHESIFPPQWLCEASVVVT